MRNAHAAYLIEQLPVLHAIQSLAERHPNNPDFVADMEKRMQAAYRERKRREQVEAAREAAGGKR